METKLLIDLFLQEVRFATSCGIKITVSQKMCEMRREKVKLNNYMTEEIGVEESLQDIIGLSDIYVPVSDVYESIKWYEKNLGCKLRKGDQMEPGMAMAIMVFTPEVTWRVPVLFLHQSDEAGGRLGFDWSLDGGKRHAVACLITPRIQELFERFKENGVNIIGERTTCGPNVTFADPDGNLWEIWQP